jgi:hypothetical protein
MVAPSLNYSGGPDIAFELYSRGVLPLPASKALAGSTAAATLTWLAYLSNQGVGTRSAGKAIDGYARSVVVPTRDNGPVPELAEPRLNPPSGSKLAVNDNRASPDPNPLGAMQAAGGMQSPVQAQRDALNAATTLIDRMSAAQRVAFVDAAMRERPQDIYEALALAQRSVAQQPEP